MISKVHPRFVNRAFAQWFVLFAIAIGVTQWLLAYTRVGQLQSTLVLEVLIVGALVLHKRLVPIDWLNSPSKQNMQSFLKSFFMYALPASFLWAHFITGLTLNYLPRAGFALSPAWATLCITTGVVGLCGLLAGNELSRLGKR